MRRAASQASRVSLLSATVLVAVSALGGVALVAAPAIAGQAPDQLVISQVGTEGGTLSDDASPVSIVTVNSDGSDAGFAPVALPVANETGPGANLAFALGGGSDAQGSLSLSADGSGLSIGGFNEAPAVGSGDPKGTTAAVVPRIAGWIGSDGSVDTTSVVTGAYTKDNVRSVASVDGSSFYVAGNDKNTAIFSVARGSNAPVIVTSADKNLRTVGIFGGELYASSDKTTPPGISTVGTGLPTGSVGKVTSLIDTTAIGTSVTPNGFVFLDRDNDQAVDTAYLVVEGLGIYKFGLDGSSWVAEGDIPGEYESITARVDGSAAVIYTLAHTEEDGANDLLKFTDTAASLATVNAPAVAPIATAPAGTAWRGLAFAPTSWSPPLTVPGDGTGGTPSPTLPTISAAASGLPLALGDPTNPIIPIAVGPSSDLADLVVTATSSVPAVAAASDVAISGTGATRTMTVTPRAVGRTVVTVTVTNTATSETATTTVVVGVSGAATALDTPRYHDGIADGSTVIDAGSGYMLLANDEDTVIRMYKKDDSGAPVKSWDFSSHFGVGAELDLEASVRVGNTIYWSGSMSNSKKAVYEAGRNVFFSTTVTGSGATTDLSFVGSYSGLRDELMSWDAANGNALGLSTACSTTSPTLPDIAAGCNLEGLELAPGNTGTALLGFRSPVIGGKALVVPVKDYASLIGAAAGSASFGSPILLDLGGRSIRELRSTGAGQYLITAGVPDDGDQKLGWALYRWNGESTSAPVLVGTMPSGSGTADQEAGSYESIVTLPAKLVAGARVQLLTDNGTTAFYGDEVEGKDISPAPLRKSVSEWVTLSGPAKEIPATVSKDSATAGGTITVTASGFSAGESVDVSLHSTPAHLGTAIASATGTVRLTVTIPSSTPAGSHTIELVGARSGVAASIGLRVAAAVAADGDESLAFTGVNLAAPLSLAVLLLLVGLGLRLARRRTTV